MSGPTSIAWTEVTWNPTTGCTKVSPGCDHCYAETFAERWRGIPGHPYEQGFDLKLHRDRLGHPLRWRKPRLVFVNSMSDLFHVGVPDGFVMDVWRVMGSARHHTFQILTKRADRMERWTTRFADTASDAAADKEGWRPPMPRGPLAVRETYSSGRGRLFADMIEGWGEPPSGAAYPLYDWMEGMRWWPAELFNVWLGVSVESQAQIGRARHLLRTPAAVRFLSCEPLLGPIDLNEILWEPWAHPGAEDGIERGRIRRHPTIDWVIVGGESGPGSRPCDLDWLRELRDQCRQAGVAFFVKQIGRVAAGGRGKGDDPAGWPEDLRIREMPARA